jgi:CO dehydrogenase/acetyl-CoA synthase beta subunit
MEKIKTKINELVQLIEGYAPLNVDQQIFYRIKNIAKEAKRLAAQTGGQSRIKKGGSKLAALLNDIYKDEEKIQEKKEEAAEVEKKPQKRRGRPKKEKENLLATSNNKKDLKSKLNEK